MAISAASTMTTTEILEGFTSHHLNVIALRNELQARVEREEQQQSSLAKSTTENMTSYTNLSDTYSVDPTDLHRLSEDLNQYKQYFGQVKFQWMESNVKRKFLQKLLGQLEDSEQLDQDGIQGLVMQSDCERAEEQRIVKKAQLKGKKANAEQVRDTIRQITKEIDTDLNQHLTPSIEEARSLTREIQDMEIELAMLRNSRPEAERMTVEEANQTLDDQIVALQNLQQTLSESRASIAKSKTDLTAKQKEVERLMHERSSMDKLEAEARNAIKNKDRRIEESCRQLAYRSALLQSTLGIKHIQPMPNGELRILYNLSEGKTATLAIYSDIERRRVTGAKLLDSSIPIEDIVARWRPSSDLQELVLEVLARIA